MDTWSRRFADERIYAFEKLSDSQQDFLITLLNERFPPSVYETHRRKRQQAQRNLLQARQSLAGASQQFPVCIESSNVLLQPDSLGGYGIVLTAGGEGERLRLSLQAKGFPAEALLDFTKATFPLPGFFEDFGSLQVNLTLIAEISARFQVDLPVVVTTGPAGSATARAIAAAIARHAAFGIKHIKVICQGERLHLTLNEQIAYEIKDGLPYPVTNPDETGGPLMKLKALENGAGQSTLDWLAACGAEKIMVMQGTAVYHPDLIPLMAEAARHYDGLGVGILRGRFDPGDPFGSFVVLKTAAKAQLVILEQEVCNSQTYALMDRSRQYFLPYNTGFYVFAREVLQNNDLPDYATPPKEVLAKLPRSPKVGYAATDILALARKPAVLAVRPDHYGVIKNADDLESLAEMAKRFGLDELCRRATHRSM
ncbi:MAG: hypothetical protein KKH68_08105 [Proteobacteria bacterium]|nr:hypothetical protein [Pseudomonadota bacterium]